MTGRAQAPGGKTWANLVLGSWADDAACAHHAPDLWWPEPRRGNHSSRIDPADTAAAVAICRSCPVLVACLEHALVRGEADGIWGGLLPNQRSLVSGARRRPIPEMDHGTEAGCAAHRRRGEQPCQPCLTAAARISQERRERRKARR